MNRPLGFSEQETSGRLILLIGPSASGKSTLLARLLAAHPDWVMPRGVWTRDPRPGVHEDSDTVSVKSFQRQWRAGQIVAAARVHGNWYGVLRSAIEKPAREGKTAIRIVSTEGADMLRRAYPPYAVVTQSGMQYDSPCPKILTIFLRCSLRVLSRRLGWRAMTDHERMIRLHSAKKELLRAEDYDVCIDVSRPIEEVVAVVEREIAQRLAA